MMRACVLIFLAGCMASGGAKKVSADRIEPRKARKVPAKKITGPSALPQAPGEGERPELIDSSLAIELDNGRGGSKVRVGVAFALHGIFAADDAIRLRLFNASGRPIGKPVRCPQRASRRSGMRVSCRARTDQRAGELPVRNGQYRFRVEHVRGGKPHLLRKGRFRVFPCSYGLCLDKDYLTGEHWAEFEGRRLTFRVTLKRRRSLPALHKNPKRQAKAKAPFPIETITTRCTSGKNKIGKTSESFEVLDDDGVWTTIRARSGAGVKQLKAMGRGSLRCELRVNGRDKFRMDLKIDENGSIVPHKRQQVANNPIRSPWFWVTARRPKRLDARVRVSRQIQRLNLLGKFR